MQLIPLHLKMAKMVNFTVCVFYHNFKKQQILIKIKPSLEKRKNILAAIEKMNLSSEKGIIIYPLTDKRLTYRNNANFLMLTIRCLRNIEIEMSSWQLKWKVLKSMGWRQNKIKQNKKSHQYQWQPKL